MICSFCGKPRTDAVVMIVWNDYSDVAICDKCVFVALEILQEQFYKNHKTMEAYENIIRNMEVGIEVEK
ncbi:MAG TPA: hypothetical protein ENH82_11745 [bacterium]|nr:hypothetical protein [bacterium]